MPRHKVHLHMHSSNSRQNKRAEIRFVPGSEKVPSMTPSVELIRTFFGKTRGQHENKRTVVTESVAWRCTNCGQIFLKKFEASEHEIHRLCESTRRRD